jgi:ATP-binding cassette subfamily B protein
MKKLFMKYISGEDLREFKRLMSFMKKRIWLYGISLITSSAVFTICLDIFMAVVLKGITDAAVGKNMQLLEENIRLAAILIVITSVLAPASIYTCIKCIKKTMVEVRLNTFDHLMKLPMKYFDQNHSGNIVSRLLNDMGMMEYVYFFPIFNLLLSVIFGTGSIILMFYLNWRISVALILLGILSVFLNNVFSKPLKGLSISMQEVKGSLTEGLINILSGSHVIKMLNIYDNLSGIFRKKNKEISSLTLDYQKKRALLESLNYIIGTLSFIGMIIIGIFQSIDNIDNLGSSIACISLQGGVTNMFLSVGRFTAEIKGSLAGAGRVFELLDEKEEQTDIVVEDNDILDGTGIAVKNLEFSYSEQEVLNGVTFSVEEGKFITVTGVSGSGKSTLLKLIAGLYIPSSGSIHINGRNINNYPLNLLREIVSYVPQDAFLFNSSIVENIRLGRSGSTFDEIVEAAGIADAHDFIMKMPDGYETLAGENGSRLSGGQKQRIAIARAILKKSPIMMLDEATSALDQETERKVLLNLKKAVKGCTVLMVTHGLSNAVYADEVISINNIKTTEVQKYEQN